MRSKAIFISKAIAGFVGLTTGLMMVGGVALSVSAASVSELTAQINSLLATITSLQAQLGTLQGGSTTNTTTTTTTASGYTFTSNLKKGDKGEDVLQLQKLLNSDTDTQVATTGVGSKGNETNYFGGLTKAAVIKFQNKYKAEILTPVGLTVGTGYVGPSTRAKLNAMTAVVTPAPAPAPTITITTTPSSVTTNNKTTATKNSTDVVAKNHQQKIETNNSKLIGGVGVQSLFGSSGITSKKLYIMFPSKYFGSAGARVNLQGTGFLKNGNDVLFDNIYIAKDIVPLKDGSISFVIPKSINTGKYKVRIENSNGMSKNSTFFIVTDPFAIAPVVENVSPGVVKYGDSITIKGTGFTKKDNTVRTSYEVVDGLPSEDGKTITLSVTPEIFKKATQQTKKIKKDITVWFSVENKDGVSNSSTFTFNI